MRIRRGWIGGSVDRSPNGSLQRVLPQPSLPPVRLLLDNLPPSLASERESLVRCLEAMDRVTPVRAVYLFGSHARGQARTDSDVDLCIVAEGAERQQETTRRYLRALWNVWPRPAFTLVPIAPQRLAEKRACGDHFFSTVLQEGVLLATEN